MPKKSAAHQKKVDEAMRILNTTTGVIVPQAMILAGFPKKDIANETVRRMIRRRLEALEAKQRPLMVVVVTNNDADLSTLTGEEDTTTTTTTGPAQHPKPKRKQIRLTASAIQQRRVDNLAAKRHKSDAHKQKPDGMSIRMVYDAITAKYETCPSIATISRYAKRKAGTHQHFPNENWSPWPYFGRGIQVSMPGLQEPRAHQPDECVRGRQLPGEDDPDFCQKFQHRDGQGDRAVESSGPRYSD